MRFSDWSSDVCSSDLDVGADDRHHHPAGHLVAWHAQLGVHARHDHVETLEHVLVLVERAVLADVDLDAGEDPERSQLLVQALDLVELLEQPLPVRSEEHTSELQSLMRISYAVFFLNKPSIT